MRPTLDHLRIRPPSRFECSEDVIAEILSLISYDSDTGCWCWNGRVDRVGAWLYCRFQLDGRSIPVHYLTYDLFIGPLPERRIYSKKGCDSPLCVNPAHMLYNFDESLQQSWRKKSIEYLQSL